MKKFLALLLVFILVMLSLSACKSEPSHDFGNKYNPETDFKYSLEYDELGMNYITETPDGYYFINQGFLYFLDKKTMEAIPLCKKPNCLHDKYNQFSGYEIPCEAFIDGSPYTNSLFFYDNALYVLTEKSINGEYRPRSVLMKYAPDGTFLENFYIFEEPPFIFLHHRGMLYYTYEDIVVTGEGNTANTYTFSSVSLEDKTKTEIYTSPSGGSLDQIVAYGKYVYLLETLFPDDSTLIDQFLVYDTEMGEMTTMELPEEKAYPSLPIPHGDSLIFSFYYGSPTDERNKQIYKIGMDGKNPEKIFSAEITDFDIMCDNSYYYIDNRSEVLMASISEEKVDPVARKIFVYNDALELVDTITLDKVENNPENYDLSADFSRVVVASEDYLFIKTGSSNENNDSIYTLICVDKKQIGTGNVTPFIVWSDVIESNQ